MDEDAALIALRRLSESDEYRALHDLLKGLGSFAVRLEVSPHAPGAGRWACSKGVGSPLEATCLRIEIREPPRRSLEVGFRCRCLFAFEGRPLRRGLTLTPSAVARALAMAAGRPLRTQNCPFKRLHFRGVLAKTWCPLGALVPANYRSGTMAVLPSDLQLPALLPTA